MGRMGGPHGLFTRVSETTKTVVVETRAFRTAHDGTAVFSATSDTVGPDLREGCVSVALEGRGGRTLRVRAPGRGERVLDAGCGCGVDTLLAAQLVGPPGKAVGLDATPEMLDYPRNAGELHGCAAAFVQGAVEQLPFADGSFDLVISNGALNLATDKDRSFSEIARVLVPGGEMIVADLIVREAIPEHLLASMDAWST